jgi:hypothetical protein
MKKRGPSSPRFSFSATISGRELPRFFLATFAQKSKATFAMYLRFEPGLALVPVSSA